MTARRNPYLAAPVSSPSIVRSERWNGRSISAVKATHGRVDDQRMSQQFADEEISVMEAVRDTLKGLRG